jgi:hypothetical protein
MWAVASQKPPLRHAIPEVILMVAFAVFAIFGSSAADRVLSLVVHNPGRTTDPKMSDGQANSEADSSS